MKRFSRSQRIDTLLQQTLAEAIRADYFERLGQHMTITRVEVARDLGSARVYYLSHGDRVDGAELQRRLDGIAPRLRSYVGKRMYSKRTPELHFRYDTALSDGAVLSTRLGHA